MKKVLKSINIKNSICSKSINNIFSIKYLKNNINYNNTKSFSFQSIIMKSQNINNSIKESSFTDLINHSIHYKK